MIFKRAAAKLKAQDWTAIGIELAIVVIGVFIGILVANWNQARIERRDLGQIIERLSGDIDRRLDVARGNRLYFETTGRYAKTAFAGWAGDPAVSDSTFAIAAYQASQITAFNTGDQVYATLLGGDQIRKVRNVALRDAIIRVLNFNGEPISLQALRSRYRDEVRSVLPDALQEAVREGCGDVASSPTTSTRLPPKCDIQIEPALAAQSAAALRAHPELVDELNQHRAMVATYLFNVDQFVILLEAVKRELGEGSGKP